MKTRTLQCRGLWDVVIVNNEEEGADDVALRNTSRNFLEVERLGPCFTRKQRLWRFLRIVCGMYTGKFRLWSV